MKITEYEALPNIEKDDVILVDGPNGTHNITAENLANSDTFKQYDNVHISDTEPQGPNRPLIWIDISASETEPEEVEDMIE